jgi:hypothetical protein
VRTIAPRNLSTLVAVEFESDDPQEPCGWCSDWRFEWVYLPDDGITVLREWHLSNCPIATRWG